MTSEFLPPALAALSGYKVEEPLYIGARTLVYRAIQLDRQRPVAIKIPRREQPSFEELMQFRNQYAIVKSLSVPGIVPPLDLIEVARSCVLVVDYRGELSLRQHLEDLGGAALPLADVLAIAQQLADILHGLHQHRVIHKDIKPDNILIDPGTKSIRLIDFSIASRLPTETQGLQSPNALEGTLAYLSPEQTGRMNRGIDYRTDFYALGVTLYQLASGQLPFETDDPIEAIHCHIAATPAALDRVEPTVPAAVAAIVTRLMAKNAEDRYQSAQGLRFDLDRCADELRTAGNISDFALGERDLSEQFSIPEKLYGREAEVEKLMAAFGRVARGRAELVLVAGASGIGKTAVVKEVNRPIARQNGYFIKGKFDQFNRSTPLSAFVTAFRDVVARLLSESDAHIDRWRQNILAAVEDRGQVLIEAIPELENIIGAQPEVPQLSGSAAQNRFNRLFRALIGVFARADRPLVVFLDDLQWADSASLELMQHLSQEAHYLLTIGAYRDNEVSPTHPTLLAIEALRDAEATVDTIVLQPLALEHTTRLIAETLHCSQPLAQPLAELVARKTGGNPFFTTQFLKALHDDGQITFDRERRYWECDIAAIERLSQADDVVDFIASQLQKLPEATQRVITLAACIGNQFDLATLSMVFEQPALETANALWAAMQAGSILPIGPTYKFVREVEPVAATGAGLNPTYRFLHDRIQQAAYTALSDDEKRRTHLAIGRRLQANLSPEERQERLFDIVGHLNLGRDAIVDRAERKALAQDNLAAARKAKQTTSYAAARSFVSVGLELLAEDRWETQYALSLALQTLATEANYLSGRFDEMADCAAVVLARAKTTIDKVAVYVTQIDALTAQDRMADAIALGTSALAELGVQFSTEANAVDSDTTFAELDAKFKGHSIESLVALPRLTDPQVSAAMTLLGVLFTPVFVVSSASFPLLCAKITALSLEFGNSAVSTIGYIGHGIVLSNFHGAPERGYNFGKAALQLLDRLEASAYHTLVTLYFCAFIQHRKDPIPAMQPLLLDGYRVGIETGEFLHAGYCICEYSYSSFFAGRSLDEWDDEIGKYCQIFRQLKQDSPVMYLQRVRQVNHNLKEKTREPDVLVGEFYDEVAMLADRQSRHELLAIGFTYISKLILAYLFDRHDRALDYIERAEPCLPAVAGFLHQLAFHFFAGLTYMRTANRQHEAARALELAAPHQEIVAQWAQEAPTNYQHKWELLEAERLRVLGRRYEAGDFYDRAIARALENGFTQDAAIANESAAQFYRDWGRAHLAVGYLRDARDAYTRWGARAKVEALDRAYPQLLGALSQSAPTGTLEPIHSGRAAHRWDSTNTYSTDRYRFDVPVVMRAVQAISQEIEPDKLAELLVRLALANAGATRVCSIVARESSWVVAACASALSGEATPSISTCQLSLDATETLPHGLIYATIRSGDIKVFDDLSRDSRFTSDPYVARHQPKSVLCLPIRQQGKTLGLLYLENNLATGAFVRDRVDTVQVLASHAAISLENARLYQEVANYSYTLEAEVEKQTQVLSQKTRDLERALVNLQQAQSQLVQSEKMSALGQLVGGVAHEINNPVTFIRGNLDPAKDYIDSLLDLLALYQRRYPNPTPDIVAAIDEIDLAFVREDLRKILLSMEVGSLRISQIVNNLKSFSRLDESAMKKVDLHEGIDSTLLVLHSRFERCASRSAIVVLKQYGDLPKVTCYASELNQVFLCLLGNAIDALNEAGHSLTPPQIQIETRRQGHWAEISIADNGCGIPEHRQQRIFEPFFTTKLVGKGAGLGLSVSYAIVKKHDGELACTSSPGNGATFTIRIPLSL